MAERIPSFITSLPAYHLAQQTLRTDRVLQVKGLTPDGVILFREKHAGLEDLADRLRAGKAAALYAKLMNHSFMSLREKAAVRAEWRWGTSDFSFPRPVRQCSVTEVRCRTGERGVG